MMPENQRSESVPIATQLIALPFVSAVGGVLGAAGAERLRVTLHRMINKNGEGYLQQACDYWSSDPGRGGGSGRIFPPDSLMVGLAFGSKRIWRTKHHASFAELQAKIERQDRRPIDQVPKSYLSIPFLSVTGSVAAVLFADCFSFNFFADDKTVATVVAACSAFGRLVDQLDADPPSGLRNPSVSDPQSLSTSGAPAYEDVHEVVTDMVPPRFATSRYLNFEIVHD